MLLLNQTHRSCFYYQIQRLAAFRGCFCKNQFIVGAAFKEVASAKSNS